MLTGLSLLAQQGDEGGETQTPRVPKEMIPPAPPLAPDQALKSFKLQPGFRIEAQCRSPAIRCRPLHNVRLPIVDERREASSPVG